MAKEYFCAYHSFLKSVEPLSDAECGRLFKSCLIYSMTGEAPELSGNERFLFPTLQAQIDRDNEKYEQRCQINRKNGALSRGDEESERPQSVPNAVGRPQSVPNAPQGKGKDKDKGKDTPPLPPRGKCGQRFDRFWAAYPKKKSKADAQKAFEKLAPGEELLSRMLSALEQQKQSGDWQREGGQYIPYPASWLNGRRWEDEESPTQNRRNYFEEQEY